MKLTNDMRSSILMAVLRATFDDRQLELTARVHGLAQEVRDHVLKPSQIKAVDSLPRDFFPSQPKLNICPQVSDRRSEDYIQISTGDDLRVPVAMDRKTLLVPEDLFAAVRSWEDDQYNLGEEYDDFKSKTQGVLGAFTTVEKLLGAWPTIKEIMPENFFLQATVDNLPIETVNTLDETLKAAIKKAA